MQYHAIPCNTMQNHAISCMLSNCWRSVPLPCGQYMAIFKEAVVVFCVYSVVTDLWQYGFFFFFRLDLKYFLATLDSSGQCWLFGNMLARFSWPHLTSVHHPWFMVDIPWYVRIFYHDVRYDGGQPPTASSPHLTPALSASRPLARRFFFNSKIALYPLFLPSLFQTLFLTILLKSLSPRGHRFCHYTSI